MALSRRIHVESRNRRGFSRSTWPRKQKELRIIMKPLRVEMAGISIDQKRIRKDQTEIRGKLEQIKEECARLREETEAIAKQKARSQLLLALVFKILKGREAGDFATAALQEVIQKQGTNKGIAVIDK
ncbi:hypothetical protein SLEP1_g38348 [Rubroshorea leprosula]|nr:hypothetical protein SLEP1_g38348 [Rubroshorea leprosula]